MPGAEYQGNDPDGFLLRDEIVAYFEEYIKKFNLPVQYGMRVTAVGHLISNNKYQVTTNGEIFQADHVVVATGLFQGPRQPAFASNLSSKITQLHSGEYRNPRSLPDGAVLVVGSAQSGCQIAEELYESGRKVYLCVGSAGRAPRRYRGRDVFYWLKQAGFFPTALWISSLHQRQSFLAILISLAGTVDTPSISTNLCGMACSSLAASLAGENNKIILADDLHESLSKVDKFEADLIKIIDEFITKNGIDAPSESLPDLRDGYAVEEIRELDLASRGINTIIWALGYTFDFSLVKLPATDNDGYPIQQRGVTDYPGPVDCRDALAA